jgi:hypothetical protein
VAHREQGCLTPDTESGYPEINPQAIDKPADAAQKLGRKMPTYYYGIFISKN